MPRLLGHLSVEEIYESHRTDISASDPNSDRGKLWWRREFKRNKPITFDCSLYQPVLDLSAYKWQPDVHGERIERSQQ